MPPPSSKRAKRNSSPGEPLAAACPRTLAESSGNVNSLAKVAAQSVAQGRSAGVGDLLRPPGHWQNHARPIAGRRKPQRFIQLNAVTSGVKELRETLDGARDRLSADSKKTLLFVDEIHRFNRSQQDVLLPDVEEGIVDIGPDDQNPFFAINGAGEPQSGLSIRAAVGRRYQTSHPLGISDKSADWETKTCGSRMTQSSSWPRSAMATPASAVGTGSRRTVSNERPLVLRAPGRGIGTAEGRGLRPHGRFPLRRGDSLSRAYAAAIPMPRLYWLAQMLEAGEDVRFLSRRIVILASEDIGNADPHALPLAVAAMQATEFVGLPECQLPLAQAVTYLGCAEVERRDRRHFRGRADVKSGRILPVPAHLKSAIGRQTTRPWRELRIRPQRTLRSGR